MAKLTRTLKATLAPGNWSFRMTLAIATVVILAAIPLAMTASQLSLLTWALFLMMFAISWDVVSGYTGQISFGHTFFFGLGGYTAMVLNLQHGFSPIVGILAGTIVAALGGVLIGVPALRVRGPYLALLTLIAPLMLFAFIVAFSSELPYLAPEGLGGAQGLTTPNDPLVGTVDAAIITTETFAMKILIEYYVVLLIFTVIMFASLAVTGLEAGEIFTAIREDHEAVGAAGINPAKFKIFAFVYSGLIGGLAGGTFVHTSAGNPIDPLQLVMVDRAVEIIIMAVLGGMGTIIGAVVGAAFFALVTLLVGVLDFTIPFLGMSLDSTMPAPLFLLAIIVLMNRPDGLVGWMKDLYERQRSDEQEPVTDDLHEQGSLTDIFARLRP